MDVRRKNVSPASLPSWQANHVPADVVTTEKFNNYIPVTPSCAPRELLTVIHFHLAVLSSKNNMYEVNIVFLNLISFQLDSLRPPFRQVCSLKERRSLDLDINQREQVGGGAKSDIIWWLRQQFKIKFDYFHHKL